MHEKDFLDYKRFMIIGIKEMIEDILKKRSNISFFREDKIPEKSLIDDIYKIT